jgi:hypothetical protein
MSADKEIRVRLENAAQQAALAQPGKGFLFSSWQIRH